VARYSEGHVTPDCLLSHLAHSSRILSAVATLLMHNAILCYSLEAQNVLRKCT
jgi:hypothetical protein